MKNKKQKNDEAESSYIEFCEKSTMTLFHLDEKTKLPANQRAGFYVQFKNRLFVLTAGHGIIPDYPYFIESGIQKENSSISIQVIEKFHFWYTSNGLDIAIAEIDPRKFNELINIESDLKKVEVTVFQGETICEAFIGKERYGFSRLSGQEMVPWGNYYKWVKEHVTEINLILKTEDDWFYHFEIDKSHQGHEVYKGCSGSPITEATRQLSSLVVGGNPANNTIIGFKLKKFIDKLDFNSFRLKTEWA